MTEWWPPDDVFVAAFIAFVAGVVAGGWMMERKWRQNADDDMRIESGGHLYKVIRDETE